MNDLTRLTASQAARLIADREITSVELTRACLDRIAARDDTVHAFCHLDAEFSLAEAARADRESPRSALHGVPFGVKDVIDTRDLPTEFGTPIHRGRRPARDAACVGRMREAGAVLLGKLVSTEYALFTPNETRHPLDATRTPGGSSSGSAAAVGDRMVPIAFGNQTAGSLIRPAAFCGVYGFKPSHGTTEDAGILPLQPWFDTLGYMARAVDDIQSFYAVVSGSSLSCAWPSDRPPRIALCRTHQWDAAEPESVGVLYEAASQFGRDGAEVIEIEPPAAWADLVDVHRRVLYAGVARSLADDFDRHGECMSESLRALIAEGRAVTDDAYRQAFAIARGCRDRVNEHFADCDAILCPSAPGVAPAGTATGSPIFQVTWTLLGVPCLNLPVGVGPGGLPVGVQLVGRRHDDDRLLALGARLMRHHRPITLEEQTHA